MNDRPDLGHVIEEWTPLAAEARMYRAYDEGRHELRFATRDFKDKYGSVVASMRENLCPAAISAFTDGLEIEQWGDDDADIKADTEGLDRLADLVHTEAYRTGDAYALVWKNKTGEDVPHFHRADQGLPKVSDDDPSQLEWWAKPWIDTRTRYGRLNVYYADRVERFRTANQLPERDQTLPDDARAWVSFDGDGDPDIISHDYGAVPVCWWKQNAPDQHSHGRSILADVVPLQDALNTSLAHLLVVGESVAKPFWYLLNFQPKNPGNPLAVAQEYRDALGTLQKLNEEASRRFDPNQQRIFTHDGPGPFGQLDPSDPRALIEVQDAFALKIARVIGVPSYWFTQTSGQVPSGESLRVLTTRRNSAIGRFQRSATPVWRGLGQLLGMTNVDPKWASPMALDEMEKVQVMEAKIRAGYALEDAISVLSEPDKEGVLARAEQARAQSAAMVGQAFRNGQIGY